MQAVILAAGEGSRLAPLTEETPKAMVPVEGRPIVWRVIDTLIGAGVINIVVITSGYPLGIEKYSWSGINYKEVIQPEPLGTANALMQLGSIPGSFLLLGCDALFPVEHIQALMRAEADIALSGRGGAEVHHSTITYYHGGKIAGIAEKPFFPTSTTQSLMLYKLPSAIFDYLPQVKRSKRKEYEIQDAINGMIDDGASVEVVECIGDYFHLTETDDLKKFKREDEYNIQKQ